MDATEWTATLAAPSDLSFPLPRPLTPTHLLAPLGLRSRPRAPRSPSLSGPLYPLSIPVCTTRDGWLGWAPGLHPRSHLFIIKFHVYRQPVRWRSEFLSECVHTRPRGGERERGYGDTYTYTHMYAHTHTDTQRAYRDARKLTRTGRTGTYTRASSRVNSPTPLSLSLSLSLFVSLYLSFFLSFSLSVAREKESGKARIRSAVNLKINIDRGAANPLFIDADCWLHGRDAPRRLLPLPSLPLLPQHPLGFRCHVVPNAS